MCSVTTNCWISAVFWQRATDKDLSIQQMIGHWIYWLCQSRSILTKVEPSSTFFPQWQLFFAKPCTILTPARQTHCPRLNAMFFHLFPDLDGMWRFPCRVTTRVHPGHLMELIYFQVVHLIVGDIWWVFSLSKRCPRLHSIKHWGFLECKSQGNDYCL